MRMNIQIKVSSFLLLVLVVSFGIAGWIATQRTVSVVSHITKEFGSSLEKVAYERALNVFTSLETGTRGSLERGEMQVFARILNDLGKIKGVQEIGLTNPSGKVVFSSRKEQLSTELESTLFTGATGNNRQIFQKQESESLLLARAHYLEHDCVRCHARSQSGELSGVLFVRYDTRDLLAALGTVDEISHSATTSSIVTGFVTGFGGLFFACLGVYLLIGSQVRSPLEKVRSMVEGMGGGDFRPRLNFRQQDELGETASSINRMAGQMKRLISDSRGTVETLRHVVTDVTQAAEDVAAAAAEEKKALSRSGAAMQAIGTSSLRIKDEINDLDEAAMRCSSSLLQMTASIEEVASSSDSLAEMVQEVSGGIGQMANSVQLVAEHAEAMKESAFATASSIEEMDVANKEIDNHAREVAQIAESVQDDTEQGRLSLTESLRGIQKINTAAQETDAAMQDLTEQATSIGSIVSVIEEITEQTNLLALNAAIIAAQSGENGKGFAVVADEIRELANRTRSSTQEIAKVVDGIREVTAKAVTSNQTSHAEIQAWQEKSDTFSAVLSTIFNRIQGVSTQIRQIATSTSEQSRGTQMVRAAIDDVKIKIERAAQETLEQSQSASSIAESAHKMLLVTTQVKHSTREQSQTSRFISKSMSEICAQAGEIRTLSLSQEKEGAEVRDALAGMQVSCANTGTAVTVLDGAVHEVSKEAKRLEESMAVFRIDEDENPPEMFQEGAASSAVR